ncbi:MULTISPECIES: hypothetical protein [Sporosarcina]|nr:MULTISPECIES: hypothetical protein [Sporosarcina]
MTWFSSRTKEVTMEELLSKYEGIEAPAGGRFNPTVIADGRRTLFCDSV